MPARSRVLFEDSSHRECEVICRLPTSRGGAATRYGFTEVMKRRVLGAAIGIVALVACTTAGSALRTSALGGAAPAPREAVRESAATAAVAPLAAPTTTDAPMPRAVPVKRPGAYANLDPDDDLVVAPPEPRDECEAELAAAGVSFRPATLAVHTEGKKTKITCGAPQVVTYLKGPGKIAYSAPPLLTCGMALALASFEKIVQEEAERSLHSRVVRIEHLGTYSCRQIARFPGWVSEHSYANAIDIARFVLKTGAVIDVLHDFDVGDAPPKKPAGAFLRSVSRRANDEDVFSHVLTPFYDAGHNNHFHLDLSRFRTDGTRPPGAAAEGEAGASP